MKKFNYTYNNLIVRSCNEKLTQSLEHVQAEILCRTKNKQALYTIAIYRPTKTQKQDWFELVFLHENPFIEDVNPVDFMKIAQKGFDLLREANGLYDSHETNHELLQWLREHRDPSIKQCVPPSLIQSIADVKMLWGEFNVTEIEEHPGIWQVVCHDVIWYSNRNGQAMCDQCFQPLEFDEWETCDDCQRRRTICRSCDNRLYARYPEKDKVIQGLIALQRQQCCYVAGKPVNRPTKLCDCKFGCSDIHVNRNGKETGCPELRTAIGVLENMTDDEYVSMFQRAAHK